MDNLLRPATALRYAIAGSPAKNRFATARTAFWKDWPSDRKTPTKNKYAAVGHPGRQSKPDGLFVQSGLTARQHLASGPFTTLRTCPILPQPKKRPPRWEGALSLLITVGLRLRYAERAQNGRGRLRPFCVVYYAIATHKLR